MVREIQIRLDEKKQADKISAIEATISGGTAGLASRFVISPLDVVKIRLQLQADNKLSPGKVSASRKYNGMIHAVLLIYKEEGIRGLWKGNLSAEYLYVTYGAVQFLSYHEMNKILKPPETAQNTKLIIPAKMYPYINGSIAGTIATLTTYPFDLLRTRFAAQGEPKVYTGIAHAVKLIYLKEGLAGFYRGVTPTIAQIIPYMGLVFGIKEQTKSWIQYLGDQGGHLFNLTSFQDSLSGAVAGFMSKTAVFPIDVVRKRMQVQGPSRKKYLFSNVPEYSGSWLGCLTKIARDEGIRGLYKGLTPALFKAIPSSAVTFFVYGQMKEFLENLHST